MGKSAHRSSRRSRGDASFDPDSPASAVETGLRHARVERLMFEEIAALVRDEIADPRVSGVRITAVSLSVDYRHARVHFALAHAPGTPSRRDAEAGLARASSFLRARVIEAIPMKQTPDLRFVFDALVEGET